MYVFIEKRENYPLPILEPCLSITEILWPAGDKMLTDA